MKSKLKLLALILLIGLIGVPSLTFPAIPTFRVDMDATTPGLQTEIWVLPGSSFTTNVEVFLPDSSASLSAFGYSIWWDTAELSTPVAGDISTFPLEAGWVNAGYNSISSPYIYYFSQMNLAYSEGPLTSIVASINWTAPTPITDSFIDINLGFFHPWDTAYNKDANIIIPTFEGGKVNLVPEPISSILFITGGATLGFRSYLRKKIKKS